MTLTNPNKQNEAEKKLSVGGGISFARNSGKENVIFDNVKWRHSLPSD
jgi:hypothetical protein